MLIASLLLSIFVFVWIGSGFVFKRKQLGNPFGSGFLLSLLLFGAGIKISEMLKVDAPASSTAQATQSASPDPMTAAQSADNKAIDQTAPPADRSMGLNIDQDVLRQRFHASMERLSQTIGIGPLKIDRSGKQTIANAKVGKNTSLLLWLNKDSTINGLMMIGTGNGNPESGIEIFETFWSLTQAVDPSLSKDERRALTMHLVNSAETLKTNVSQTVNGNAYACNFSHETGLICSISLPEDT